MTEVSAGVCLFVSSGQDLTRRLHFCEKQSQPDVRITKKIFMQTVCFGTSRISSLGSSGYVPYITNHGHYVLWYNSGCRGS